MTKQRRATTAESAGRTAEYTGAFIQQLANGHAWRVSQVTTLDVGEEYIIHFENPPLEEWPDDENSRDLCIEEPGFTAELGTDITGWKNAEYDANFAGDLPIIGNTNYAYAVEPPVIDVLEDQNGDFDTHFTKETTLTNDGQTEAGFTPRDEAGVFTGGKADNRRGLLRIIPPGESFTLVFSSDDNNNKIGFTTTVYLHNYRDDSKDSTTGTQDW